jgi:hypothetical protein
MSTIYAEVYETAVVDMNLSYAVTITAPYYFPPRLYKISYQEVLAKYLRTKYQAITLLEDKIFEDYMVLINDLPIMELMELPPEVTHPTNIRLIPKNF